MSEPEKIADTPEPETPTVRAIRQLVRLMKRYDLTAIDCVDGPTQIKIRRRGPESAGPTHSTFAAMAPPTAPTHPLASPGPAPAAVPTAPAPPPPAPSGVVIESPMVGIFYSSSSPEAPSFVKVGSTVRPEATVCIIEAMKVFTDIPAGVSGTVTEILVKSGQAVEFGQPLFRVNPA